MVVAATNNALHTAWACDDASEIEAGVECRMRAIWFALHREQMRVMSELFGYDGLPRAGDDETLLEATRRGEGWGVSTKGLAGPVSAEVATARAQPRPSRRRQRARRTGPRPANSPM